VVAIRHVSSKSIKDELEKEKISGIMTDFTVHRLRFGNWLPSAIKSIAVDRKYSNKVAVGREDGEIEVWTIFLF
jgi:hypothetical protein